MKILALDWGSQRVGVALCDEFLRVPLPRGFLAAGQAVAAVQQLCVEEQVGQVVVGLPRKLDGSEAESAAGARAFVQSLQQVLPCAVELFDERFSSVLAQQKIAAEGQRGKRVSLRKNEVDSLAALELLQDWLAAH